VSEEAKKETEKKTGGGGIMSLVLPALFAGAAAFGAVKFSSHAAHAATEAPKEAKPPGPTVQLDPFLVTINDATKHSHPMKVTLAIEFDEKVKEEAPRTFVPRARDACLSYLRTLSFEDASDLEHAPKFRTELQAQLKEAGVSNVERLLITDLVIQ
jgi:flagellar basal body-associated protein FliL